MSDFDFGFSGAHEDKKRDDAEPLDDNYDIHKERQKVQDLYRAIIPLLNNLAKNPEKNIVWPNRVEKIEEFKARLNHIITS